MVKFDLRIVWSDGTETKIHDVERLSSLDSTGVVEVKRDHFIWTINIAQTRLLNFIYHGLSETKIKEVDV